MSENLHNIDDLFKKALDDNEEEPSAAVWENIDRKLDKKSVINISRKYRRVKWVAAASLIVACALGMYTIYTRKLNNELVKDRREKTIRQSKTSKAAEVSGFKASPNQRENADLAEANNDNKKSVTEQTDKNLNKARIRSERQRDNYVERKATNHNSLSEGSSTIHDVAKSAASKNALSRQNTKNKSSGGNPLVSNITGNHDLDRSRTSSNLARSFQSPGNVSSNNSVSQHRLQASNDILREEISSLLAIEPKQKNLSEQSIVYPSIAIRKVQPTTNISTGAPGKDYSVFKKINSISRKPGFSATIFYSPDFVTAKVQNDRPRFREDDRNEIKKNEDTKVSSTIGVLLNFNPNNSWTISSGVTYFTRTTDIRSKTIYARPDNRGDVKYRFNSSVGYSYVTLKSSPNAPRQGDSVRTLSAKSTLQYIGVPLAVKYNINLGRFSIIPGIGLSANFLAKGAIETSIASSNGNERSRTTDIQGLRPSYLSGSVGIAASYKLNETFAFSFMPTSRFGLSPITKDAPVKTYLNSTGFVTALTIKL